MERRLGDDGELQIISPLISMEWEGGMIDLTWENTTVRTFGDPVFNHIEHRIPNGDIIGIDGPKDLYDTLFEAEFPYQFNPVPDENTFNFREKTWLHQLKADIDISGHGD